MEQKHLYLKAEQCWHKTIKEGERTMTKLEKIETAKKMGNEELLEYLLRYTKQNFFEMEESKRETYSVIKEEVLKRMNK